jgi:hypothetical protein
MYISNIEYYFILQFAIIAYDFSAVLAFYAARKFAEMKLESAATVLQTAIRKAAALRWRSRLVFGVVKAQARYILLSLPSLLFLLPPPLLPPPPTFITN